MDPKEIYIQRCWWKRGSIDSFGFRRCQRHFGNYSHTGGRSFAFANSTSACTWCHIGFAEASNDFAKASIRFRPTWDAQWTCDGWHFRFCKRRFWSAIRSWSEIRVCAWRWWTSWSNAGSSLTSSIRKPSQVHHRAHHHPWRRCSNKRRSWWAPIQPRSPRRCTKRHRWRWILGALGEIGESSWTKSSSFWRWPPFKLRRTNGLGAGLAASLICGLGAGEVGGLLPHGDPKHASAEAAEVQRAASSGGERMYPPQERAEGGWERSGIVHRAPGLSCTLGEPNEGIRSAKHPEGAEQGPLGSSQGDASTSRGSSLVKQAETAAERDVQMLQMLEPEEMVSNWPTGTTSISDRDASKHAEDQEGDHGGASTEQRGAQAAREPTQPDLTAADGGDQTSKRGRSGEGAEAGEDDADDAAGARGDEAESSCAKSSPHGSGGGSSRIDLEEVPLRGRPRKVPSEEGRPPAQTMVWPRASLPSLWRKEGWDCVRGGRGGLDPLRECRGQTMGIGAQSKEGRNRGSKPKEAMRSGALKKDDGVKTKESLDPCTKQAVRVKVKLSAKKRHVYEWDEGKETSFSRKDRRLLKRAMDEAERNGKDPCTRAVLTAKGERGRSSTRTPRRNVLWPANWMGLGRPCPQKANVEETQGGEATGVDRVPTMHCVLTDPRAQLYMPNFHQGEWPWCSEQGYTFSWRLRWWSGRWHKEDMCFTSTLHQPSRGKKSAPRSSSRCPIWAQQCAISASMAWTWMEPGWTGRPQDGWPTWRNWFPFWAGDARSGTSTRHYKEATEHEQHSSTPKHFAETSCKAS